MEYKKIDISVRAIDQFGMRIGDVCQCIRPIGQNVNGDLVISKNSLPNIVSNYWQPVKIALFQRNCWPSKDDTHAYELSLERIMEKEECPFIEGQRRAIASYPHIPGTIDFGPYIEQFVELNGKVQIELNEETSELILTPISFEII